MASAQTPLQIADNAPTATSSFPATRQGISAKFLGNPGAGRKSGASTANRSRIRTDLPRRCHRSRPRRQRQLMLRLAGNGKPEPRIYTERVEDTIPSIPPNVIEPFIEPLIVDDATVVNGARIVAMRRNASSVWATRLCRRRQRPPDAGTVADHRPGKPLLDLETKEVLGHEAFYPVPPSSCNRAKWRVRDPHLRQEVGCGDRLPGKPADAGSTMRRTSPTMRSRPVPPAYGGVGTAGRNSIITSTRGPIWHRGRPRWPFFRKPLDTFRNESRNRPAAEASATTGSSSAPSARVHYAVLNPPGRSTSTTSSATPIAGMPAASAERMPAGHPTPPGCA